MLAALDGGFVTPNFAAASSASGRKHVFPTPPSNPTLKALVPQPVTAMGCDSRTATIDYKRSPALVLQTNGMDPSSPNRPLVDYHSLLDHTVRAHEVRLRDLKARARKRCHCGCAPFAPYQHPSLAPADVALTCAIAAASKANVVTADTKQYMQKAWMNANCRIMK